MKCFCLFSNEYLVLSDMFLAYVLAYKIPRLLHTGYCCIFHEFLKAFSMQICAIYTYICLYMVSYIALDCIWSHYTSFVMFNQLTVQDE